MQIQRRFLIACWAVLCAIAFAIPRVPAAESAAVVAIEKAGAVTGPWTQLPANQVAVTPDGNLVDPATSAAAFYRLKIALTDEAGSVLGLPLNQVPPITANIAKEHLESLQAEEAGWQNATLGPIVVPVYSPAVGEGKTPAFLEFKVVPLGAKEPSVPDKPGQWRQSAPIEQRPDRGYILVSTGDHHEPLLEYATKGLSPSEKLRRLAKSSTVHIVRFTESFWVAENGQGELVATYGSIPHRIPAGILDYLGKSMEFEVAKGQVIKSFDKPKLQNASYNTYKEFKEDFTKGDVYTTLRRFETQRAKVEWDLRDNKPPEIISVPLKQAIRILPKQTILAFDLEDPIATITINPLGGLNVEGGIKDSSLLMVILPDHTCAYYVLALGQAILGQSVSAAGWSSWSTCYACDESEVPAYDQEWDLSGCCNDGWSGCGPTAWALFYGYWDNRGTSTDNLIAGAGGTPWTNDDNVRACLRQVFDYCDTWCAITDAAATNPWDMHEGYRWADHQGEGIDYSSSWTLPYTSSGPRNRASSSICDHNRPAIVGTGYYEHYPLAIGYRSRRYTWAGTTWKTERQWFVNNGWGSSDASWVSAKSCWFGMNGYCY